MLKNANVKDVVHDWITRGNDTPKVCPKCKSPYWNTPRKNK